MNRHGVQWVGWGRAAALLILWGSVTPLPQATAGQETPAPAHPRTRPQQLSPSQTREDAVLAAAQDALNHKNYAVAAALLENYLLDEPGRIRPLLQLAYCYTLMERTADAIDLYKQILELDPKLFPARLNLGLLFLSLDRTEEAVTHLQQAVELNPQQYQARFTLGAALEELGKTDEALAHYRRAAELDPKQTEAVQAALHLFLQKEDWHNAAALVEELGRRDPNQPRVHRLRGELLLRQNQPASALSALEEYFRAKADEGSELTREDAELHVLMGRLYRQQSQPEEALRHFQAAAQAGAAELSLPEQARTLAELERWQEALPFFQRAVRLEPNSPELRTDLGRAYLHTRQYPEAIAELTAAVELNPRVVTAYEQLASALYLSGNLAGTIEVLTRRSQVAAETPGTLFLRAISHDKLGQCASALDYYQRFLTENPDRQSNPYFQATGRLRALKKTCREKHR